MESSSVTKINIYLKDASSGELTKMLTVSGDDVDEWKRYVFQMVHDGDWSVVMEAERSEGDLGDAAIDDVSFTKGCTPLHPNGTTSSTPQSTTSHQSGDCTDEQFKCKSMS